MTDPTANPSTSLAVGLSEVEGQRPNSRSDWELGRWELEVEAFSADQKSQRAENLTNRGWMTVSAFCQVAP